MPRVITPAGLDLGDVQDEAVLAYYRGEGYTFPDDEQLLVGYGEPMTGIVVGEGETGTASNPPALGQPVGEPISLDLSKPPLDVAEPVVDEVTPTVDATAGALPEPTDS